MTINIVASNSDCPENQSSPFDAIRQYDDRGCEWWSARDLQKMLGYKAWQMFDNSIELGLENLESAIGDVSSHALILEITLKHQKAKDYKLSRIACYHIALACDSRGKPNVKAAKHYFATKTREAEIAKLIAHPISIPAILPEVRAVQIANSIRHITDTLDDNPRLAQLLIDLSISGIIEKTNLLTGTDTPQLRGVAEIAADMKLPVSIKNRGDLGKFVVAAGFKPQSEKRLVNGAMRDVNCYPDTPELRQSIEQFFN
jgi:hypothetical protein